MDLRVNNTQKLITPKLGYYSPCINKDVGVLFGQLHLWLSMKRLFYQVLPPQTASFLMLPSGIMVSLKVAPLQRLILK